MIRVCLVEDQALVREGLVSLLATLPDIHVVAEATDGREAIAVIGAARPDVVVLDVRLPHLDGIGVIRELASREELPPTLLLTTFDDDEALIRGVMAGARGFILKDVTRDQLADAIRTLAAGGSMIHPIASARIARGQRSGPPRPIAPAADPPTEREMEVLRLMAAGLSNREIGDLLGMVEGTVKNHVSSLLSKLHARDRTRAVLRSFELGWL